MSPPRRISASAVAVVPSAVFLLVLLLLAPVTAFAQGAEGSGQEAEDEAWQPLESFGEAISVDITDIEVWVTDRDGRPVTGLTADDFVLSEDGERVKITNFSAVDEEGQGSWSAPEPAAPASATAPAEGEPYTLPEPAPRPERDIDPESRLHLAILIDNWNLQPADRARVFDDLRSFLREHLRAEDRAMVLVHDRALGLVQEMTNDPDLLMAALNRIERAATANIEIANERRSALENIRHFYENATIVGEGALADPCQQAWGNIQSQAQGYATSVMAHTQRSGGALASAGDLLAGVPGRKILLYVGSGLPQQAGTEIFHYVTELCPHQQSEIATWVQQFDLTWLYEEVARRANANDLTLYTIEASAPAATGDISMANFAGPTRPPEDSGESPEAPPSAGGFTGNLPGGSGGGRPTPINTSGQTYRPSASATRSAELDSEAGLFYVANETGGRAILNAADFAKDFEKLATELRTYYSLGFTPEHQGDGRIHEIDVSLKKGIGGPEGGGWRVRHRQSYHDKPYDQRMAEKIRGVAQFGTESNRLHVRVETGEATPTAGGYRVPIRLWVPLDEMTLLSPDGKAKGPHRAGRLRVMMAVSDAAGNLGPVRQKVVAVEVGEGEDRATGSGREHLVEVDLDLPTARHVVALGVRDELGGETSFLRHSIDLRADAVADGGE